MGMPTTASDHAPLWRRGAARLVDTAAVFFVLWFLVVIQLLWFVREASQRFQPSPWGALFVPLCAFLVLSGTYEALFVRRNNGQTPGKQLFAVRVATTTGGDVAPSRLRALVRWSLPALVVTLRPPWAMLVAVAVLAAPAVLGARGRAVHDLIAGTTVVSYVPDPAGDDADRAALQRSDIPQAPPTMADLLLGTPYRQHDVRQLEPCTTTQEADRG